MTSTNFYKHREGFTRFSFSEKMTSPDVKQAWLFHAEMFWISHLKLVFSFILHYFFFFKAFILAKNPIELISILEICDFLPENTFWTRFIYLTLGNSEEPLEDEISVPNILLKSFSYMHRIALIQHKTFLDPAKLRSNTNRNIFKILLANISIN